MDFFLALLVRGLLTGSIYALVALGFVLVYKATGIVNFAQGEMVMFGGFFAAAMLGQYGLPTILALPLTVVAMMLLGVGVERSVLRTMVGRPILGIVMATIGLAFFLRGLAPMLWGASTKVLPLPVSDEPTELLGVTVPTTAVVGAVGALLLLAGFGWYFQRSRAGIALRAVADDQVAAMTVGISVPRVFGFSMGMAGVVAAGGGLVWGNLLGVDTYLALLGLKVFPVAILGGLDSVAGVLVGGLVVGATENVTAGYVDPYVGGGTRDLVPFVLMLLVLMVRPFGLFGKRDIERV
ncbi:MAG TPA: branched-chain amino acid ABC transporter permease [Acidimicrobiales bacterium]|nr:branched-chain amino acid ABC transporter permease [Acidimicrobiales bacterium]